jgi:hypothetical protein
MTEFLVAFKECVTMIRFLAATLLVVIPCVTSAQVKQKEEKQKVRTFAVEQVVLQMFLDYKAIENAVADAKGNEFKRAEARKEWTKKWNDKWAGQKLRISGNVDSVFPSQAGVTIRMGGKQTFKLDSFVWQMEFTFSDAAESEKAKKVDAGKKATIEGTVKAIDGKNWTPMCLDDCRVVDQPEPKKGKK